MLTRFLGIENKSAPLAIDEVVSLGETAFELTGCMLGQWRVFFFFLSASVHG